jgi:DNA-binding transcriptional regulator YdaS (Cro superfamily)
MNLTNYVLNKGGTAKISCPVVAFLAGKAGCSPATLYMIAIGHKKPGPKLAARIEHATFGTVSRHDLRPDIFGPAPAKKPEAQDAA